MSDWNSGIIEEFRANEGRVGDMFEGWTLLLLHHTGAKTGTERVTPLAYQAVDSGYAVFASKGGATDNPDWYHNLLANPEVAAEIGADTVPVRARVASTDEREPIWSRQKAERPQFADYEETAAGRQIPVVILEPR